MLPMMKVTKIAGMAGGASALAACTLLYDPGNLPSAKADAAPDAPTIVVSANLGLDSAGPLVLFEGQGTGGSRPAILAIKGHDIAQDAMVALMPVDVQGASPMITVDNDHAVRSLSGTVIAVPVTLPIDTSRSTNGECKDADQVALTVVVTQVTGTGPVTQSLQGKVSLCNLPELDASISDTAMLVPRYSRVNVPAGLTFTKGTQRAIIRAVGSINLGDVHADAIGAQPGPGGGAGGARGMNGSGPGGGRSAGALSGGLLAAGSGGGYGEAGAPGGALLNPTANPGGVPSGEDLISSYTGNNPPAIANGGSGGGGGDNNPGGGGGGTLELTAGGTLTVGKVSANGASVTTGNGGGGSGGSIVLRSGAVATIGQISTSGGASANGGVGGRGRLRYDVPALFGAPPTMATTAAATMRRGVEFSESLEDNPLITHDPQQLLKVISVAATTSATAMENFKIYVLDAVGTTTTTDTVKFDTASVAITPTLRVGYNRVCVTPPLGNPNITESTNCIDIAYVR